ncbi:aminopeptidase [Bacillus sp. 2205SS5-2]|uniref:aminopeptidase n=1 Tax=Bacillus sp. 2205SS5-2 TaxID=3109031 RepID=UPI0030040DA6
MNDFDVKLNRYADLIIEVGLNIQPGQKLIINSPVSAVDFVRIVTEKAYKAGTSRVLVQYFDEIVGKLTLELATEEGLEDFPTWIPRGYEEMAEENVAFLNLNAPNPTLLKDVDPNRVAISNKAQGMAFRGFQQYIVGGKISWLIAAIPTMEWAETVFPKERPETALSKLWDNIFYTTRVDQERPVELWKEHIGQLNHHAAVLNEKDIQKLHYKGPGTDLTIEFDSRSQWISAGFQNEKGIDFVPNLPTEEVFTIPVRTGVNGIVQSTKPLNYSGNLIKDFSLTFKDGKVVDFQAKEGYETLKKLLDTDDGACYLGEVALVPHDSPISNTNLVFNNTLFDENASCHLALGNALNICVKDESNQAPELLEEMGFNTSITHVDFMIGSAELNIDAIKKDGTTEPIFRNGNWASNLIPASSVKK